MSNYISNVEATELLSKAIKIQKCIELNSESTKQKNLHRFRQIRAKLQNYIDPVNNQAVAVEQIPLKIRRCFVRAVMLLTRYPRLVGKPQGTYKSYIVSSYRHDRIPDSWYKADMSAELCRLFQLSSQYAEKIEHLLTKVDRQIVRQKQIMQALINEFNGIFCRKDVLQLFQNLFGYIAIPETSIDCLATEMQVTFIIDYQEHRLKENIWQTLSASEQQNVSCFLKKISQFSWQQFAHFPSFGYVEVSNIDSQLLQRLANTTGYSKGEITKAISSSVTVLATERVESFLLHDICGHYWQSILTQFGNEYTFLSQIERHLNLNLSVKTTIGTITLQQLFYYQNGVININESLAKSFFHCLIEKSIFSLSTHLVGEILADINEYKWLSQNRGSQDLLLSTSCFKDFPTKLDLTIKDLQFLYTPLLETLIKLPSSIQKELIKKFNIENWNALFDLQQAIAKINRIFLTEYINRYQQEYTNLSLNLLKLQNLLNKLYTKPQNNTSIPFQDLIILFVSNCYSSDFEQNLSSLNLALANYFLPCWQLLDCVALK